MDIKAKIYNLLFIITGCVLALFNSYTYGKSSKTIEQLDVQEAIDNKLVEIKIVGDAIPVAHYEAVDGDGAHFGKCMKITFKNLVDSLYILKLVPGKILIPLDTNFQEMLITKTVKFPIYPFSNYSSKFYAMCAQINYDTPYYGSEYKIGGYADKTAQKLANYFEKYHVQSLVGQHALWAYTDRVDQQRLIKFGADSMSIAQSIDILNTLSIKTPLNENSTDFKTSRQYITLNKNYLYAIAVLVLTLISTIAFLLKSRQ